MFIIFLCYSENYLFKCGCVKCLSEADDPDVTSEEEDDEEDEDMEWFNKIFWNFIYCYISFVYLQGNKIIHSISNQWHPLRVYA